MKRLHLLIFLLFVGTRLVAQEQAVSGKVTDASDGSAIVGVTVTVKGTTRGTITNAEGEYKIQAPATAALVFSFIGFITQEVPVANRSTVNVALTSDTKVLSEVVVTAIGLEAERDKLGTASSTVKGNSLVQSGETSVINGLAARTPGVLIQRTTGDPGASSNIQIRGASTITGNLQPLIVIDGIPVSNSSIGDAGIIMGTGEQSNQTNGVAQQSRLNDINPDDIASMEVLRGASAAALWGTRAANGVLVITTKKGKRGDKVNISLRSAYSVDQINKVPALQKNYGQGSGGKYNSAGGQRSTWGDKIADRSDGPDDFITEGEPGYIGYAVLPDGTRRYAIAPGTDANPHGGKNSREVFDHGREVFSNGYTRDNTLSIGGGDEKSSFYISLGNTYTKGIAKVGSDYDRSSFRINADRQLTKNFKAIASFNYIGIRSNRVQQGSNTSGIFLAGLRTSPDFDNTFYLGDYVNASGTVFTGRQLTYRNPIGSRTITGTDPPIGNPSYDNPFWIINEIKNTSKVQRTIASMELNYQLTDWLSIINRMGLDTYRDRRRAYFPIQSANAVTGSLQEEEISETQINNDFIIRATKQLNDKIGGTVLVGANANERRGDQVGITVTDLINPLSPPQTPNSNASSRTPFNLQSIIRTGAVYSQVDVEALNMLYLTLTGRLESASTFGPAQSTFFYPSGALAWQFSQLPVFQNSSFFDFGKLRLAVGQVGIQPPPYQTRTYLIPAVLVDGWGTTLDASAYRGGFGISPNQGNNALKPERKTELETGLDLRFWNGRLNFSGTFYINETVDAILQIPVAATTGFLSRSANAARLNNRGVELEINADVIKKGDFTWTLSPNWSFNRNRVTDLRGATNILLNGFAGTSVNPNAVEGYQMGVLFGARTLRGENGQPTLDANGFPQLDPTFGVVGDPNPAWRAGFGTTFRFKNLSLFALIDHVHDFDVWNGTKGTLYVFGTHGDLGKETVVSASDAATIRNSNGQTVTEFGRPTGDGSFAFRGEIKDFGGGRVALDESWYTNIGGGFNGPNDQFVENINTTRLREITLSYTLNSPGFRNATKLQSIDFSVTGRNLYLWTGYTGVDPETNLTGVSNGRGIDYFNNPGTRSFLFSVKINY